MAHAVAAGMVSEMENGWIRKETEESRRRIPVVTEDGLGEPVGWETGRDLSLCNMVGRVGWVIGYWKEDGNEDERERERERRGWYKYNHHFDPCLPLLD
ncbi:hypothetical protein Hanom_Chr03g00193611 [Helianthus anomalus]